MKPTPRRVLVVAALLLCRGAAAPAAPEGFALPTDPERAAQLDAAARQIRDQDWAKAVRTLRDLLDAEPDATAPVGDAEHPRAAGVRAEARRLLASLPPAGRKAYEEAEGRDAAEAVKGATKEKDGQKLAEVMRRWPAADSTIDALDALAALDYDAGRLHLAADCYARLLERRDAATWPPEALFRAADAFRRTGDEANAVVAAKALLGRVGNDGLQIGDKKWNREELRQELTRSPEPRDEWPMFGGDPGRTAQGAGGKPWLVRAWEQPTTVCSYPDRTIDFGEKLGELFKKASDALAKLNQPVFPPQFPVTASVTTKDGKQRSLVVYRTHAGVAATDVAKGRMIGICPLKGTFDWMMDGSRRNVLNQWTQSYIEQNQRPGVVFENTVIGTLSIDGDLAYTVEDLAVPPPAIFSSKSGLPRIANPWGWPPEMLDAMKHSRLMAYELSSGCKLVMTFPTKDDKDEFQNSFFLGAPLLLDGRLFVLNEKDQEARLICLETAVKGNGDRTIRPAFSLSLGKAGEKQSAAYLPRRVEAAQIAYGRGVLVCPTNAGWLVGVNLLTRDVAWAYRYERPKPAPAPPPPAPIRLPFPPPAARGVGWVNGAPVVAGDAVVIAPPDDDTLACVDLETGAPRWRQAREDGDLYLGGVYDGRVVVVGEKTCRAFALADGKPLWAVETGMPSGRGAAAHDVYYLPLRESAEHKGPELCAIDLAKGQIVGHSPVRTPRGDGNAAPLGNLVFADGWMISQTTEQVVAYRPLAARLKQIDAALAENPADADALVDRARLRLENDDAAGAVDDSHKALDATPAPEIKAQAREVLFAALTRLLNKDFSAGEKFLKEYEELCAASGDAHATARRRAALYILTGRGFADEGKPNESLSAYERLAALDDELMPSPDDPWLRLRPSRMAAAGMSGLLKKATPDARKALEDEIGRFVREAEGSAAPDALPALFDVLGPAPEAGFEARLKRAERLIDVKGREPEAEMLLAQVAAGAGPEQAARAVDAEGRLSVRRGRMEDALYYYDILNREYGATKVRDGMTGAELYRELQTDKRFLPFVDAAARPPGARWKAAYERGPNAPPPAAVPFTLTGDSLPSFRRYDLRFGFEKQVLEMVDRAGGGPRWQPLPVAGTTLHEFVALADPTTPALVPLVLTQPPPPPAPAFPYRTLGRVAVVPAGECVCGVDAAGGRLLWRLDLARPEGANAPPSRPAAVRPQGDDLLVAYAEGFKQRIGPDAMSLAPSALCLMTADGLAAFDPVSGRRLWLRTDVAPTSRLFGDAARLAVVESDGEKTSQARVLNVADGSVVPTADFRAVCDSAVSASGCNLLTEVAGKDGLTLRLYDPAAGKDVWKETYPAGSIPLRSLDARTAGAAERTGAVHVLDMRSGKAIMTGAMNPNDVTGVETAYLLADDDGFYVACNRPAPPAVRVESLRLPESGMRDLPVNGEVVAFDGATGKVRWRASADSTRLLLDHFAESPVMMLAARTIKTAGPFASAGPSVEVRMFIKRTGKLLYQSSDKGGPLVTLSVDPDAGRVELVSTQEKWTIKAEEKAEAPRK